MGDEEDQETLFAEMDGHQLAEKTAWVRLFFRDARRRGYSIEDVGALLDDLGITASRADSVYQRAKAELALSRKHWLNQKQQQHFQGESPLGHTSIPHSPSRLLELRRSIRASVVAAW
jgi:hypothetical protein